MVLLVTDKSLIFNSPYFNTASSPFDIPQRESIGGVVLRAIITAVMTVSFNLKPAAYSAEAKPIVFAKDSRAIFFRDEIQECAQHGANFAGHYVICSLSGGTDTQVNFIIDLENRKIVAEFDSELGIETYVDSDIIVVNPEFWMSDGDPIPNWLSRRFYRLDKDGTLSLIGQNRIPGPKPTK